MATRGQVNNSQAVPSFFFVSLPLSPFIRSAFLVAFSSTITITIRLLSVFDIAVLCMAGAFEFEFSVARSSTRGAWDHAEPARWGGEN